MLKNNHSVIDAENLRKKDVHRWMKFAEENGFEVFHKDFPVELETALKRNTTRKEAGEKVYDNSTVERLYAQTVDKEGNLPDWIYSPSRGETYMVPRTSPNRDFLKSYNEKLSEKFPPQGNKVAIIDVDGTLANNSHHVSQYLMKEGGKDYEGFFKSIESAPPNRKVLKLIKDLRADGISSIVLSGRTDVGAKELATFLTKSGAEVSRVILRPNESNQRDFEFKKDAVKLLKKEGVVPILAVDDRPRSIALWEELGVPVEKVEWIESVHSENFEPLPEPSIAGPYSSGSCVRCGRPIKKGIMGPVCGKKIEAP